MPVLTGLRACGVLLLLPVPLHEVGGRARGLRSPIPRCHVGPHHSRARTRTVACRAKGCTRTAGAVCQGLRELRGGVRLEVRVGCDGCLGHSMVGSVPYKIRSGFSCVDLWYSSSWSWSRPGLVQTVLVLQVAFM